MHYCSDSENESVKKDTRSPTPPKVTPKPKPPAPQTTPAPRVQIPNPEPNPQPVPQTMETPCIILAPIWGRKGQGEGLGLQLRQRWKKMWTHSNLERWQRPISVLEWWKGFSQPKLVWGERVSKSVVGEFQGKFSKRGKRGWIFWQRGEGVRTESSQATHPCPEF